jgi:predicted metal-dependent HD superfamily phosphohydrolase
MPSCSVVSIIGPFSTEPHRQYHNRQHVLAVRADAASLAQQLRVQEPAEVQLAACAHDVVYDGKPGDDERASAAWAQQALQDAGVAAVVAERVAALVLATIDHVAADDDVPAQILLDADLAILAAPPEQYDAYARAVRREYAAVPDDLWQLGRGSVLQQLLDKNPLYLTPAARERWEAAARENLRRELAALG